MLGVSLNIHSLIALHPLGEQPSAEDPFRQHRAYQNTSTLNGPFYTESSNPASNGPRAAPVSRRGVVEPRPRPAENGTEDTYDPWGKPGGGARHAPPVSRDNADPGGAKYDFMGRPVQESTLIQVGGVKHVVRSSRQDSGSFLLCR